MIVTCSEMFEENVFFLIKKWHYDSVLVYLLVTLSPGNVAAT